MRFDWRAICGPALTTATALTAFAIDRYFLGVPNPAPLFVCIVAVSYTHLTLPTIYSV